MGHRGQLPRRLTELGGQTRKLRLREIERVRALPQGHFCGPLLFGGAPDGGKGPSHSLRLREADRGDLAEGSKGVCLTLGVSPPAIPGGPAGAFLKLDGRDIGVMPDPTMPLHHVPFGVGEETNHEAKSKSMKEKDSVGDGLKYEASGRK